MTKPGDAGPVYDAPVFLELLSREAGRANRYRDFFGLCLLAPDVAGGSALASPADLHAVIVELLRSTDLVGRVADAVAVLLVNTSPDDSLAIAERLRARLAGSGTVSIGLASFPRDGMDASALLERARTLMEHARLTGGDRVRHAESLD